MFDVLRKEQLFIKLSKCEIAKPEVTFLGHIVGKDGVVDITKFEVIHKWKTPTCPQEDFRTRELFHEVHHRVQQSDSHLRRLAGPHPHGQKIMRMQWRS